MAVGLDHLAIMFIASAISLAATLYFNIMSSIPNNYGWLRGTANYNTVYLDGIFNNTQPNISDKYPTQLTPAGYTFAIWSLIYLFQMAWVIYSLTTICRKNSNGNVYRNPAVLPGSFHASFILSCVGNIGFLFSFDREQILMSAASILTTTIFGFIALSINCRLTKVHRREMQGISPKDLTTIYVLVQNGLDLYFSWTLVASSVAITMTLQYSPEIDLFLDPTTAAAIGMSYLLICCVIYFMLDINVYFDALRKVYAHYFIVIWGLVGILVKNFDASNANSMMQIVGIGITALFLAAKITLTCIRPYTFVPYAKIKM